MADSFSELLRLRLQETGANTNTWGAILNSAALQLIEDAIARTAQVTVANQDVTLTAQNGAQDQARCAAILLTGAPGATRNIIVPAKSKIYLVINQTGQPQTVKTASGTGVTVPHGARQLLYVDGTNVTAIQADVLGSVASAQDAEKLGGVEAAKYARKDAFNVHTAGFATTFVELTDGPTITLDASKSNKFRVTLGGNRQLQILNPTDGQTIELWIKQDAGGGRTLAWPANVRFDSPNASSLTAAAGAIDVYELSYNGTEQVWVADARKNVQASGGTTSYDITIAMNTFDVNLHRLLGSPSEIVTVNVTVQTGVVVQASDTSTPAIDTSGFASGSIINLVNNGYILGKGGDGGRGCFFIGGNEAHTFGAQAGRAGGPAIKGPGAGRTLNITNNGFIWGGGGGGGGGGVTASIGSGGGGGGGAGGGKGGLGMQDNSGSDGTHGPNGAAGAGGVGRGDPFRGGIGNNGGAGGDWGQPGSAGANGTQRQGGAGGAAGKAVDPNSGTVNFLAGGSPPNVKGAIV